MWGDPKTIPDESIPLTVRVHDECNGSVRAAYIHTVHTYSTYIHTHRSYSSLFI